jgi:hypothetical protein
MDVGVGVLPVTTRLFILSCLAQVLADVPVMTSQELEKVPGVVPAVQLKLAVVPEKLVYAHVPEPGTMPIESTCAS